MSKRNNEIEAFVRSLSLPEMNYAMKILADSLFSTVKVASGILDRCNKQTEKLKAQIADAESEREALRRRLKEERAACELLGSVFKDD